MGHYIITFSRNYSCLESFNETTPSYCHLNYLQGCKIFALKYSVYWCILLRDIHDWNCPRYIRILFSFRQATSHVYIHTSFMAMVWNAKLNDSTYPKNIRRCTRKCWSRDDSVCFDSLSIPMSRLILFCRADSRFAPSQWGASLQSNAVSHWLGANLESALFFYYFFLVSPRRPRI